MEITQYSDKYEHIWAAFIDASANGTIFHEQQFLAYHPAGRFEWHHLLVGNPGIPAAIMPAAVYISEHGQRILRTPMGATLGGPVLQPLAGLYHTQEIVKAIVGYAREHRFDGIVLGTVPSIYWATPDDTLEFVLRDAGFACIPQLMHYVAVARLPAVNIMEGIPVKRRKQFRRALRDDLTYHHAETPEGITKFYEVLVANRAALGVQPVHTLNEVLSLKQRLKSRLRIRRVEKAGRTIAGVYCIEANNRVCYTQYAADDPAFREYDATRFALYHLLRELQPLGYMHLDFGPSVLLPIEKGSLAQFKESFGAVGCERRAWRLMFDKS